MRTTKCFPWCLLLAWVWPLQAQQTTVKDTVVANDEGAGQKETVAKDSNNASLEAQSNLTIVHLDLGTRLTPFDEMIIGKEKEVLDLTAKGDYANWANLLSDDAVAVYDTGYASKAEVLKALKGMSDFHCSMDKVRVMPIGKTAALIIYRMTQGWKEQGKPMTSQYYISSLWVKRGGKWLSQFWQETDTTNSQAAEEKTVLNQNNSATDTKELLQIETDLLNAYVHRDLSVRDRYVADEFVGVDGSGNVYSKQQDMQELKEGTFAMKSFMTEGVQVRIFGDSAIVTGRNTGTSVYKGKEQADTIRYVDTFLKRDGRWQLVYSQDTNVANTAIPEANATEFPPDSFFIAKEKEDWEALKHKDKAAAARLLADDFVGMYDFGFFNKSEWVKQMDDQYTVDDYTIEGPKVLHPSPTTALLLYTSTCKGTGTWAEDCFHPSRVSDLLVERNGQWLSLFSQDTAATSGESDDVTVLKEILASEYRIVAALSRDDIEGFAQLLPEDVIDIDDDGVHTKAEWIPEIQVQKDRGFLFRDFRFDDPKLIRLGPDQATFTAKEIIHGLDKGKSFELRYYTNATYVRRNGKWVPRVYQDTPMVK